ncbi:uncharacterized protein LOC129585768 [Paramacrobiotus metropolitanus]|uniref:uncharacterized protein LOC129585768 n=1 Tax=Paramacrobiotus metropolitanus TaxID=2943436 RepID=UPI002445F80A|nr:uncharacterized protein LOC129585768 [Paramacrobiotus metropolitanus]
MPRFPYTCFIELRTLWLLAFIFFPVFVTGHPVTTDSKSLPTAINYGSETAHGPSGSELVTFDSPVNLSTASKQVHVSSDNSGTATAVKLTLTVRMENNTAAIELNTVENLTSARGEEQRNNGTGSIVLTADNKGMVVQTADDSRKPHKVVDQLQEKFGEQDFQPVKLRNNQTSVGITDLIISLNTSNEHNGLDVGMPGTADNTSTVKDEFSSKPTDFPSSQKPYGFGNTRKLQNVSLLGGLAEQEFDKDDDWKDEFVMAEAKNLSDLKKVIVPAPEKGNFSTNLKPKDDPDADQEVEIVPADSTEFTNGGTNSTIEADDEAPMDFDETDLPIIEPAEKFPVAPANDPECHDKLDEPDNEGSGDDDDGMCEDRGSDNDGYGKEAGIAVDGDNDEVPRFAQRDVYPQGTIIGLEENLNGHLKDVTNGDEIITIWINLRTGQIVGSTLKSLGKAQNALLPVMGKDRVNLLTKRFQKSEEREKP